MARNPCHAEHLLDRQELDGVRVSVPAGVFGADFDRSGGIRAKVELAERNKALVQRRHWYNQKAETARVALHRGGQHIELDHHLHT